MKPEGAGKKTSDNEAPAAEKAPEAAPAVPVVEEKIDFSKVEIEPFLKYIQCRSQSFK